MIFKDQLIDLAKTELNRMFLAKIDFKDLQLSFIKKFPNAYIALEGLEVTGVGDFKDQPLAAFDIFSVTVNLVSVIKMDNIEVRSILLDRARLNGHILEDGRANWEIFKPSEKSEAGEIPQKESAPAEYMTEAPSDPPDSKDPFKFKVGLSKFEIRDLQASFLDEKNKMKAEFEALNLILRGDMKKENVDLKLNLNIDGIDFWLNGVRLANKVKVGFVSEVAADLKNLFFTLKDNKFNLNEIVLKIDGSAGIKGSDISVDASFATDRTDFKSLLSLVPAIYMNEFKNLHTTGSLDLSGNIKGTFGKDTLPSADVNLSVNNAMFKYPALPASVEKINIAVRAHYDGEVFDRTTADIDRFSFEIAGNPFAMELHAKTPESDLQIAAKFAGKIDIDSITDIIPLDDIVLNGLLDCNIVLAGRLSTIEKEQYEDFQLDGHLGLSKFKFESPAFPLGADISSINLNFSPRRVELVNLDATVGTTDVAVNGSLENFIPFIFKNDTIRGTLAVKSNNINLNEFMSGSKDEPEKKPPAEKDEASALSVIEVPKNVDFRLTVDLKKILFDKLFITNAAGAVTVKDGKLNMQNLGMNLLEGSMVINGEYNTQNIKIPFIDFGLNVNRIDITSALSSFSLLEKFLPEPDNYSGKVSAELTLHSTLDEKMSPVLNSINSKGRLRTHNLGIKSSEIFAAVARFSRNDDFRTPAINDLNIGFEIKDGRFYLQNPIVINIKQTRLEITGDQGLDSSLNYKVAVVLPVSVIRQGADVLSGIPFVSNIKEIKIAGFIRGTAKNPEISLGTADMAGSVVDTLKDTVVQKLDEVKTQVSEEVNKQIDQIMEEARKQADNLRNTAKQGADALRREAASAADKLESEAGSNPLLKTAAKISADRLRREGEDKAKTLEQEADKQAKAVIEAAEKRANDLKR